MDFRAAQHVLAIRAPLNYFLISSLLTKPSQFNIKRKYFFLLMLKRSLMKKMMTKVWQSKPRNNEMRARTLCVCRAGDASGNLCLQYWYRFLAREQFFVGSWGREIQRTDWFIYRKLLEALPETSSEECWTKANFAYDIGNIDETIRLFAIALASRF